MIRLRDICAVSVLWILAGCSVREGELEDTRVVAVDLHRDQAVDTLEGVTGCKALAVRVTPTTIHYQSGRTEAGEIRDVQGVADICK